MLAFPLWVLFSVRGQVLVYSTASSVVRPLLLCTNMCSAHVLFGSIIAQRELRLLRPLLEARLGPLRCWVSSVHYDPYQSFGRLSLLLPLWMMQQHVGGSPLVIDCDVFAASHHGAREKKCFCESSF